MTIKQLIEYLQSHKNQESPVRVLVVKETEDGYYYEYDSLEELDMEYIANTLYFGTRSNEYL